MVIWTALIITVTHDERSLSVMEASVAMGTGYPSSVKETSVAFSETDGLWSLTGWSSTVIAAASLVLWLCVCVL